MSILSDKTIEATKRAAMVTTAIAWLVNNIPTSALPAPLAAAVTLLKAVVPFLGYIGESGQAELPASRRLTHQGVSQEDSLHGHGVK